MLFTLPQEGDYLIDDPELTSSRITWVNGYLFLNDEFLEHKIRMYDASDGTFKGSWGRSGRGPGDYNSVRFHPGRAPNLLEVVDTNNKKIDVYDTECLGVLDNFDRAPDCISDTIQIVSSGRAIYLGDNQVLDHSSTPDGNIFLATGNHRERLAEVPEEIFELHASRQFAVWMASGLLVASPDRASAAFFAGSFDYAQFFNLDEEEGKLRQTNEHQFSWLPDFEVMELDIGGTMESGENYRHAFSSAIFNPAADAYYVLYSGKSDRDYIADSGEGSLTGYSEKVRVFTREGHELESINLGVELFHIAISSDGSTLFGLTMDEDFVSRVVKIDL